MKTLIHTTYRQLIKAAAIVDRDVAARTLLTAGPTQVYDHYSQQWLSTDTVTSWHAARQNVDFYIRMINKNRELYVPPASKETEQKSVVSIVRDGFRQGPDTASQLGTAFSALKLFAAIEDLSKQLPEEPKYKGNDFGLTICENLDQWEGRNDFWLLAAHPLLPDFFRHTIVAFSRQEDDGAFGLVLNKPLKNDQGVVVPVWSIVTDSIHPIFSKCLHNNPVMVGGPVASALSREQAMFIVHCEDTLPSTTRIAPGLFLGGDLDELQRRIVEKTVDTQSIMVMIGYAGWGAAQLQGEAASGSWIPLFKKGPSEGAKEYEVEFKNTIRNLLRQANVVPQPDDEAACSEHPSKSWSELLAGLSEQHKAMTRLVHVDFSGQGTEKK